MSSELQPSRFHWLLYDGIIAAVIVAFSVAIVATFTALPITRETARGPAIPLICIFFLVCVNLFQIRLEHPDKNHLANVAKWFFVAYLCLTMVIYVAMQIN